MSIASLEPIASANERVCTACGAAMTKTRIATPRYSIVECSQCHLALTLPTSYVTCADYNATPDLAAGYASKDARNREYADHLLSFLAALLPTGRILDVGCSIGTLVKAAEDRGFIAEGIDLDETAVAIGRKLGRNVFGASIGMWKGRSYDAILLQHTLEHISEPVGFLTVCDLHLRPGGLCIISVPCHDGLLPRIFPGRWYGWQPGQHYYHYSLLALEKILNRAGFEIVESIQNSMDYRFEKAGLSLKSQIRSQLFSLLAGVGATLSKGDQIYIAARKMA